MEEQNSSNVSSRIARMFDSREQKEIEYKARLSEFVREKFKPYFDSLKSDLSEQGTIVNFKKDVIEQRYGMPTYLCHFFVGSVRGYKLDDVEDRNFNSTGPPRLRLSASRREGDYFKATFLIRDPDNISNSIFGDFSDVFNLKTNTDSESIIKRETDLGIIAFDEEIESVHSKLDEMCITAFSLIDRIIEKSR